MITYVKEYGIIRLTTIYHITEIPFRTLITARHTCLFWMKMEMQFLWHPLLIWGELIWKVWKYGLHLTVDLAFTMAKGSGRVASHRFYFRPWKQPQSQFLKIVGIWLSLSTHYNFDVWVFRYHSMAVRKLRGAFCSSIILRCLSFSVVLRNKEYWGSTRKQNAEGIEGDSINFFARSLW